MTTFAIVDSFASGPFTGNPAGVCLLNQPADEGWMRLVAAELNMPATAFVHPAADDTCDLRWFTPLVELELCGHGTLAAAHVLWERGLIAPERSVRFRPRAGELTASRRDGWIELDFPAKLDEATSPPEGLIEALKVEPAYVGRNQFDYVVEVKSEAVVREMKPDFDRLRGVATRGVIVTARSATDNFDFVSRFFAPSVGLNEDSATGSAHCCLGPFWAQRLPKTTFMARQLSARGATIAVAVDGPRVRLAGQAVTVASGDLVAARCADFRATA